MFRLVWAQLVRRGSRTLALLLGLLVACAGFTVLTGQTRTSTLQVRSLVKANARSAYDILVRPKGSATGLEKSAGLVRAGFLSGIQGGISLTQWHRIQQIPGVAVAAPVAVIGYVVPKIKTPAAAAHKVKVGPGRALLRLDTVWRTDNGASTEVGRPSFVYVTPNRLSYPAGGAKIVEHAPDGKHLLESGPPDGSATEPWTVQSGPTQSEFWTAGEYRKKPYVGDFVDPVFAFPFLIEAIDPASEAKMAGLKGAVVSGHYLPTHGLGTMATAGFPAKRVPVLVAARPATHLSLRWTLSRLPESAADAVGAGKGVDSQLQTHGAVLATGSMDQADAYRRLLHTMTSMRRDSYFARQLSYLYTTGPQSYRVSGDGPSRVLRPRTVHNKRGVWASTSGDELGSLIPAGADDTAFRAMTGYHYTTVGTGHMPPVFAKQGVFDPAKLRGQSALAEVPLGTYASTVLTGADAKARKTLGDRPLQPSPNIAGYPQPAPLMLTTLSALPAFEKDSSDWGPMPGDRTSVPFAPVSNKAPISSIRIKVGGVTGVDAQSRQRVRLVAQQISQRTHLRVDITVGSSPSPQTIHLAAGRHGRPALNLTENWVQKGTAIAILQAVDKKSLALFVLVLVVCGLFVSNAAAASVRARRSELGILASVGWPRSRLFGLVLTELLTVALVAGIGGALVAWAAGAALGVPITAGRAAMAIPAALVVALVAGAVPARLAAYSPPMEAVRPAAHLPRRPDEPHSVAQLAWANVRRVRVRSTLAAAGFAVAIAALTAVAGILIAFHGAVVGTLLGNAVTVQIRGADYAAVVAVVVLAAIGVANVMFLNVRERGRELATLRALGWNESTLTRLLIIEGSIIGLLGSIAGAVIGLGILAAILGAPSAVLVWTAVGALVVGILISAIATLVPAVSIRRLPTALLLTEE